MNADFHFACPHCHKHLSAGPEHAGSTAACPSCGLYLIVPDLVPPAGETLPNPSDQTDWSIQPNPPVTSPSGAPQKPAVSTEKPAIPAAPGTAPTCGVPPDPALAAKQAKLLPASECSAKTRLRPQDVRAAGELDFNPAIRLGKSASPPARLKKHVTKPQPPTDCGQPQKADGIPRADGEKPGPETVRKSSGGLLKAVAALAVVGGLAAAGQHFLAGPSDAPSGTKPIADPGGADFRTVDRREIPGGDASGHRQSAGVEEAQQPATNPAAAAPPEAATSTTAPKAAQPAAAPPAELEQAPAAAPVPAAPAAAENSAQPPAAETPRTPLGEARHVLDQFLAAPDWKTRLTFSLNAETIRDSMAAHFRDRPDGPVPVEGVAWLTNGTIPGTERIYYGFRVGVRDLPADIPMAVEDTGNGFLVDWVPFLEAYEQRLKAFVSTPQKEPGQFRVILQRKHYFGDPVPGQDKTRLSFGVECPMRDQSFSIWLDTGSEVYQKEIMPNKLGEWGIEASMIAELVWRGDEKSGQWVELNRVVANNWQGR